MKLKKMYQFFFTTTILIFFGVVGSVNAQIPGTVLQEYGFESGADTNGTPVGCKLDDYNGGAQFVIDQTVFHSGAAAGLIEGVEADTNLSLDAYLPNSAGIEKGGRYKYSVWLKTEMTDGVYAVQVVPQWDYYEYNADSTGWVEYTGEFDGTKDGEGGMVIGLYGSGKVWIDDVKITVISGVYAIGDSVYATSFEEGTDSTGLPLVAAYKNEWQPATAVDVSDTAHTGNYSAMIYSDPSDGTIGGGFDILVPGHEKFGEYHLSVWIKTELTAGSAQIITAWDNARFFKVEGTTGWTKYEMDYTAPNDGDLYIRFHGQSGVGKMWFDDFLIVKNKDGFKVPTDVVYNPGFELPNDDGTAPIGWSTKPWGSGSTEIGAPGNDTARYIWDNTVFHSGQYSAKIQVTQADVDRGSMDAGWNTQNLEFVAGGLYEMSWWGKAANMASTNYFRLNIGYNNVNLTMIRENTDWVQIKDTLLFPTDQENNAWRNQMRFRLSGAVQADTMAEVWVDDVEFRFLGIQANQLDSVTVVSSGTNSVTLSWPAATDAASPVYHILMQPYEDNGFYTKNVLDNPGFETPNGDGSAPESWEFTYDQNQSAALGEWPAAETYDGNFSVFVNEQDTSATLGIYARWDQVYEKNKLQKWNAYLYGAMVKYNNVTVTQEAIKDARHPNGEYYTAGVNIIYDRYAFTFQNENILETGWSTPIGTSNGWEQIFFPLIYDQAATRHHISIGLGGPSGAVAKGNLLIDNAFVVPFEEVANTTETSYKVDNVPTGVKYFAVYVEDGSGEKLASPARIGTLTKVTDVKNEVMPYEFKLENNYPNPFNPTTQIEYTIAENGPVKLQVFDILGRKIMDLVNNKEQAAGRYSVQFNASKLSSGVYFYRIVTQNHVMTKKMMLIK